MDFEQFKKHDGYNAILVGGALLVICPFLTWAKVSALGGTLTGSGTDLTGLTWLLVGAGGYLAYLSWMAMDQAKIPDVLHLRICGGVAGGVIAFGFSKISDVAGKAGSVKGVSVSYGIGFFLAVAGAAAVGFGLWKLHNASQSGASGGSAAAPPAAAPPAPAAPPAAAPPAAAPPAPEPAESEETD